jgi:replication-associated recombination protein RarA
MDLFDYMRQNNDKKDSPLAMRLRPKTLDEIVGQKHIIGKGTLLYRAIKADKLSSVIFYGPPGTGKTTLAKVIANTTSANFKQINATIAGKKDMEEVIDSEFEGHQVKIMKGYDDYLSKVYGDYMKLPPIEKQVTHHSFTAYWKS